MGFIAAGAISAVGAVASGSMQASAAQNAAQTQANSAAAADQIQQQEFNQQQANLAPWVQAGTQALGTLQQGVQPGGQFNTPFTLAQFQQSPSYTFQQQQGQAGIQNSSAAGGMSGSPAEQEALIGFNQGLASENYQQAYQNYMGQENFVLDQTQSLAQIGQTATNNLNTLGGTNASTIGGNIIGAGNALAAGQVGAANAYGNALTGVGSSTMNAYTMNSLLNNQNNNNGPTADPYPVQYNDNPGITYDASNPYVGP